MLNFIQLLSGKYGDTAVPTNSKSRVGCRLIDTKGNHAGLTLKTNVDLAHDD